MHINKKDKFLFVWGWRMRSVCFKHQKGKGFKRRLLPEKLLTIKQGFLPWQKRMESTGWAVLIDRVDSWFVWCIETISQPGTGFRESTIGRLCRSFTSNKLIKEDYSHLCFIILQSKMNPRTIEICSLFWWWILAKKDPTSFLDIKSIIHSLLTCNFPILSSLTKASNSGGKWFSHTTLLFIANPNLER